jgi:hypothetical protein
VRTDFTAHLAAEKARTEAEAFLQKLKEGKEWTELAGEPALR